MVKIVKHAQSFESALFLTIGERKYDVKSQIDLITTGAMLEGLKEIVLTTEGPDEEAASLAIKETMTAELLRVVPIVNDFAACRKRKSVRTKEAMKDWLKTERFAYVHSFDGWVSTDRIRKMRIGFSEDKVQCEHLYAGDLEQRKCMPTQHLARLTGQINKTVPTTLLVYRNLTFRTDPEKFMSVFEQLWYHYPDMDIIFGPAPYVPKNFLWYGSLFEEAVEHWNSQCFDLAKVYDYFRLCPVQSLSKNLERSWTSAGDLRIISAGKMSPSWIKK